MVKIDLEYIAKRRKESDRFRRKVEKIFGSDADIIFTSFDDCPYVESVDKLIISGFISKLIEVYSKDYLKKAIKLAELYESEGFGEFTVRKHWG